MTVALTGVSPYFDAATETLDRAQLRDLQLRRLQALVEEIVPRNAFYTARLGAGSSLAGWEDFAKLPFTTKAEIAEDQLATPPYGTNASKHHGRQHSGHLIGARKKGPDPIKSARRNLQSLQTLLRHI